MSTVYMCGTNSAPPPLSPPPPKCLFHGVILKNYLILYAKQHESGSLNEVSCWSLVLNRVAN